MCLNGGKECHATKVGEARKYQKYAIKNKLGGIVKFL